jgi:hypothetical protein
MAAIVAAPMPSLVFTAYGVTAEVVVDRDEVAAKLPAILPPGWRVGDPAAVDTRIELRGAEVLVDSARYRWTRKLTALDVLDSAIRLRVSALAPERVFIHAGAVEHEGRALVLPGPSLVGKTTLVAALLSQGAAYLSDEYAVLDAGGRVHPYPKPLSRRADPGSRVQTDEPAHRFGAVAEDRPLPVGLIAVTRYERGAEWRPARRAPADGAMVLLENAVPARERPRETLAAVRRACAEALVLEGPRGDAAETAQALLQIMARERQRAVLGCADADPAARS